MKPVATREKLHSFIDLLPVSALDEIYNLLNRICQKKLKTTSAELEDGISRAEVDLLLQRFLC